MSELCQFCEIAAGRREQGVIGFEDEHVVAFPPIVQKTINKGRMLVVPKKHFRTIFDVPEEEYAPLIRGVVTVAQAVKVTFEADGISISQHNDPPVQDVFHVHFHVVPRKLGEFDADNPRQEVSLQERIGQAALLRQYVLEDEGR